MKNTNCHIAMRKLGLPIASMSLVVVLALSALIGCGPSTTPSPTPSPTTTAPIPTTSPTPTSTLTPTPTTPPPPAKYTLTLSANPGGSISPSGGTYDAGSKVSILPTPEGSCWAFDHWSGDTSGNVTPLLVTMDKDKTITANFAKLRYTLTVTVSPPGSGSVGPNGGTFDCSSTVALAAVASANYTFDHWGGDASGTSTNTTLTMTSNKNVTANFKSLYQTITRDMPPGSMVLNTVTFTNQFKAGDRIQGFVELTGDYHQEDAIYGWNFVITGPQGIIVENWQGNVLSTQRHDFDKTLQFDGSYIMKVYDNSRWAKTLNIQIKPGGWGG
ncbi:MAG: InlB B-repeat-containing protein [Dehalococcoidales bacterium]|nr:InlB B-repeat-containing protein [Dehalococcoidales bacterium]